MSGRWGTGPGVLPQRCESGAWLIAFPSTHSWCHHDLSPQRKWNPGDTVEDQEDQEVTHSPAGSSESEMVQGTIQSPAATELSEAEGGSLQDMCPFGSMLLRCPLIKVKEQWRKFHPTYLLPTIPENMHTAHGVQICYCQPAELSPAVLSLIPPP